ncbi:MAG: ATP synthase F1 subunit gamma [Ignavibacteria bacterium]|nr:ATP synthase F1 subunit gamma [Ignavibacteria bacterium]
MPTLRDIRRRILAVASTKKITQAMRMVSTAKLKRAQDAIINARPYSYLLRSVLEQVATHIEGDFSHPLLEKRKSIQNYCLIVVTSDRGLCGSFNSNLIRFLQRYINEVVLKECQNANISMIRLGKRGISGIKLRNIDYIRDISGISGKVDYGIIAELSHFLIQAFIEKKFDKVIFIFNEFKNILTQVPSAFTLLPFDIDESLKQPQKVTKLSQSAERKQKYNLIYLFEPNPKAILDNIIPKYVENQIFRIILESNAAEHAARRMAMENATNNAIELIEHLQLIFNKERQASITKEMLDIVGGANALKSE